MVQLDANKIYSYREFHDLFPDDLSCRKYLENVRWGNNVACIHCASLDVTRLQNGVKSGKRFQCNEKQCRKQFSATSGTIMHNTTMPLPIWFSLIYSQCVNNKNISSVQMSKNLGVTQVATWQNSMKIKCLFADKEPRKLKGIVEIDECYLSKGGFNSWYRMGRKTPIIGMMERSGEVRIFSVQNRNRKFMETLILDNVEENATIYTDGCRSYNGLHKWFEHDSVNHKEREWISVDNPEVHTQTIESVWSRLKKSIRGANHSVSQKHLQKYCDEVSYRINYKHLSPVEKFNDILLRACNYKQKYFSRNGTTND